MSDAAFGLYDTFVISSALGFWILVLVEIIRRRGSRSR